MRKLLLIVFFVSLPLVVNSQCGQANTTYKSGELIEYEVYYNWGFIWLNAGWVKFQVKDSVYKDQETILFDAYGASHPSYDWLYKVRDRYMVHIDKETLLPQYFYRNNNEGDFTLENKYRFNWHDTLIYSETQNSDKPYSLDTIKIPPCTFDVLSLIYYTRNINFNNLELGDKVPISSILDNEVFDLYIRYLGKEAIKDREGRKYNCIKFSALVIEGSIFKGGEDMYIWVTDDANKVPVMVEAKILIGSVKAYLRKATGLRNNL